MDYKETYEKFWKLASNNGFDSYVRNSILHNFFSFPGNNKRVADVGGGSGIVSEWLKNGGYDVFLIDFSDTAIKMAQDRGIEKIFKHKIEGVGGLPFDDNYFDIVFLGDIIEHLFDVQGAISEIRRILKPSGRLILSCPNMAYWRFRSYYLIDGDFERIDVARQKPWEQEHIRFYNIRVLKELFNGMGFCFIKYAGVNNIWHSRLLSKYFPNIFAHTIVAEFIKK